MVSIEAIRDFFLASDAEGLERAYRKLHDHFQDDAPEVTDWQTVEFAFNRLFVGPKTLEAPPFSSVYLDARPQVMSKTTLEVREMYAALGLESPWKNTLPDDHISLELDAVLAINQIARQTNQPEFQEFRERFMTHMTTWIPLFTDRILKAPSAHPAITYVVDHLSGWLRDQAEV